MEQTIESDLNRPPSGLWRVLRVVPLAVLIGVLALVLVLLLLGGLQRIAGWYLLQYVPPLLGLLVLLVIGVYALIKRRISRLWAITAGVAVVSLLPLILWFRPVAYPASLERTTPAATVRLPADAPLTVAWGGDTQATNYHVVAPDQRWAYDLVVAPAAHGSANLEEYGCYGVDVVAPADGVVTAAHDGEPDETPGVVSSNVAAATGNHVGIRLDSGTYLVIAHLKPSSVAVAVGDRVTEGQVIGQCGNSGNTSEPHIHIHHQRQDPAVFPLNFAEGLPLYFRDHDGPSMPVGGYTLEGETVIFTGDVVQHVAASP
jgi:hypothetical protein